MFTITVGFVQLTYTIFWLLYTLVLNIFYITSYVTSLNQETKIGIDVSRAMIVYCAFTLTRSFLQIYHLNKIAHYYGKTMTEHVWWNVLNSSNWKLFTLLRVPYSIGYIYGIFMSLFGIFACTSERMCLCYKIIIFTSSGEVALYFISLGIVKIINWQQLTLYPDNVNIFMCIIYSYCNNYMTQIVLGKEESNYQYKCSICLIKTDYNYPGIESIHNICVHKHRIHKHCLREWIKYYQTCPLCSENLIINLDQEIQNI